MSRNTRTRTRTRTLCTGSIVCLALILMVVIFGVFYLTVYQGMNIMMAKTNRQNIHHDAASYGLREDEMMDGIPHPALGHLKRHHPSNEVVSMEYLHSYHGTIILHLEDLGDVTIRTRADWSAESVAFVHQLAKNHGATTSTSGAGTCERCTFYRAETPGIFQGMMVAPAPNSEIISPKAVVKGSCPPEFSDKQQDCPPHDLHCACHGPIMERGYVGWAGGGTGPDFFINMYAKPAKFWGNQHTVWGQIVDEASLQLIDSVFQRPVTDKGGMHYLDENIKFTMSLP